MAAEEQQIQRKWLLPRLKLRVWFAELVHPTELQVTLFWAGVIGFAGALSSVAFKFLTDRVHWLFTHQNGGYVQSFEHLLWWQRLLVPALGGTLAGLIIYFGTRIARKSSTDYMEAIVVGEGVISFRSSAVKCASAMFSIASGASIGREGPLVQLSAVLASLFGRWRGMAPLQLRLLVACGAAAGIASAYNAPIGGALFVAEIVLQSLAMESFGPLVFSSVVATLTIRRLVGDSPLYEIQVPSVRLHSNWEILPYLLLGLLAGFVAPWFLKLLRGSERVFSKIPLPVYARVGFGGLAVGALAILHPEVIGNGYSVINQVLHDEIVWKTLLVIFIFKLFATAATFGSGAVGGVFTPTLFAGACLGELFCNFIQRFWVGAPLVPAAFALVGMGAFLAATTHAPLMAIIIVFELTLDYDIILPLMLACVIAHYTCSAFEKNSVYSESLQRKGADVFRQRFATLSVGGLMKPNPVAVGENARFTEIAEKFIRNRFNYLYVVDDSQYFRGAISLHDIKSYLNDPELAQLIIARDILREGFPTIVPEDSLATALERFSHHDGERLPVVSSRDGPRLLGSISKTDLLLALTEATPKAA
jgi:CIC family chloride channel protein